MRPLKTTTCDWISRGHACKDFIKVGLWRHGALDPSLQGSIKHPCCPRTESVHPSMCTSRGGSLALEQLAGQRARVKLLEARYGEVRAAADGGPACFEAELELQLLHRQVATVGAGPPTCRTSYLIPYTLYPIPYIICSVPNTVYRIPEYLSYILNVQG